MIVATTRAASLRDAGRLDARYFLSPGFQAARGLEKAQLAGLKTLPLGGVGGLGHVWAPPRFTRVYAVPGERSLAYLRPYDIFKYLPRAADHLSLTRTADIDAYRIEPGVILQTLSGRNLGPGVVADSHVSEFALSHDLARIGVPDERLRFYLATFLQSRLGQELLRRKRGGSVIDHIGVEHIATQPVPILPDHTVTAVSGLMRRAAVMISNARESLRRSLAHYEAQLPDLTRDRRLADGWTVPSTDLGLRLDAASHDLLVRQTRLALRSQGGCRLGDVATPVKPSGRYKTRYVDEQFGIPMLSGAQALQLTPINLRSMAPAALNQVERYRLRAGWTVFQADGRSEEGLGEPAMVPPDVDGWLASGHVGRVIPHEGVDPGWLFSAIGTEHVQLQIKALAAGSVVDAVYADDLEEIVLPPHVAGVDGACVSEAWAGFAEARALEQIAVGMFENEYSGLADLPTLGVVVRGVDVSSLIGRLVHAIGTESDLVTWLQSPIPFLDERRPIDLIVRGDVTALARLTSALENPGAV